jgi:uncharacterized protein (TIGR02466 family)
MFVDQIFPTNVLIAENLEMANLLLPICEKYTDITQSNLLHISNFPSTLSDRDLMAHVNTEPVVQDFMKLIATTYVRKLAESSNIIYSDIEFKPYGFFSSMNKYAYLRKHLHKDCSFSGTFYLKVDEDVPPLVFYDPRPIASVVNKAPHTLSITPKTGMLLLWESWLEHEIPQKLNDNARKTFSFNI